MSILDLYAKGTSTGMAPKPGSGLPTAAGTAAKLNFDSAYNNDDAGKNPFRDMITALQQAGAEDPMVAHAIENHSFTPKKYMNGAFDRIDKSKNRLVTRATTTSAGTMLGPGHFPTDIVPYTERVFSQQAINAGMAITDTIVYSAYQATTLAVAPTAEQIASTIVPIATPTTPSRIGTIAGMGSVVDDGRYDITVGYGYILYQQGTYGS